MNFFGFIGLFIHNLIQDYSCLFGGLLLLIPALMISYINSRNFLSIFIDWDITGIIFGALPHGIFEIPSSIFALAGGLMFFTMELKILKGLLNRNVKEEYEESKILIKDAFVTAAIVFVLLFIAALIETFITPQLIYMFCY